MTERPTALVDRVERGGARAVRNRRLALSLLTSLVSRPLAFLVQMLVVPLLLAYLGRERYGIFETISALSLWLGLANVGLSLGLLNNLISCYVTNDQALARRYVAATMFPMIGIVVVAGLGAVLAVHVIPLGGLFRGLSSANQVRLPSQLGVAVVAASLTILGNIPTAIYTAYQETHRNNLWDMAAKLAVMLGTFLLVHTSWGVVGALAVAAGLPASIRIINGVYLLVREKPWLLPRLADFEPPLFWISLRQSLAFFVLQSGMVVMFQTDKVIISTMFGAQAAADFALVSKVFVLAYGAFSMVYAPLWTGHGEALQRGDLAWVRRGIRLSVLIALAVAVACGAAMLLFGDKLLQIWLHASIRAPASLCLAFSALFALRAWVDCRSVVLNSAAILRPQMLFFAAQSVLFLIVSIAFGKWWGPVGVAWGGPIAALCTTAWGYPWMIRHFILRKDFPKQ